MEFTTETNYGECHCCLTKGNHRYLTKEYYFDGNREMYADIFIECFNLFLNLDVRLSSLICRACIKQLKDAHSFRKSVITVEDDMIKALRGRENHDIVYVNGIVTEDVKEEIKEEHTDDERQVDYFSDDEVIVHNDDADTVLGEKGLLERFPKYTLRPLPTRTDLHTLCPGYIKRLEELKGQVIKARMVQEQLNQRKITHTRKRSQIHMIVNGIQNEQLRTNETSLGNSNTPVTEKMAHVANISTLLENSNLTAFMTKFKNGYPCFYCKKIFEKFDVLKEHQTQHTKDNIRKLILKKYRKGRPDSLVVYVDVTDLKCTLCGEGISTLNELKCHLTKTHNKTLYSNYSDRVIPYKMADNYMCQVCSFNFETFGAIERHMNTHYRNYVCEDCGAGFIARHRLKTHKYNLHSLLQGKFACDICKKIFPTGRKYKIHNDLVHKLSKKLQCPKCPARFSYYYVRQKHLFDVHGESPVIYKCNVCEKEFKRRYNLSIHTKKEHLNQGDFNCEVCAYSCYSSNELRVHLVKKHGENIDGK